MQKDALKPSQVDATPDVGSPKPEPVEPGKSPKLAETEAQPDKPVPSDRD